MKVSLLFATILALAAVSPAAAADQAAPGATGIRLGLGTDISGGIAYGGQLDYTLNKEQNAVELGLALFGGTFEEDSDNGFNDYHEESTVLAFGAIANYLFRYAAPSGPYFVVGAGFGAFSVDWVESSPTDTSLGTPLPGGGSKQEEDGTAGGMILNFGIGKRMSEKFDLRIQVPTFIISAGDERDGATVPTLTVTAGVKF